MENPTILYIDAEQMLRWTGQPYFGITYHAERVIAVRSDLPAVVQKSVLGHERWHFENGNKKGWWASEAPAWWAGFKAHWLGFLLGILMSLTPSRIWLYIQRVRHNF